MSDLTEEDRESLIKAAMEAVPNRALVVPVVSDMEWVIERIVRAREAQALRDAADSLEWVRPEVCPCDHPEGCCGSESSCDAMQPTRKVVGQEWLRERADQIEGGN